MTITDTKSRVFWGQFEAKNKILCLLEMTITRSQNGQQIIIKPNVKHKIKMAIPLIKKSSGISYLKQYFMPNFALF